MFPRNSANQNKILTWTSNVPFCDLSLSVLYEMGITCTKPGSKICWKDWSDACTNQGMPRVAKQPLEAGRSKKGFSRKGFGGMWHC